MTKILLIKETKNSMSIQDKIARLQTAKENIADAITAKRGGE